MKKETRAPTILLATDLSKWAQNAEEYACSIALSYGASLIIMSVLEFPPGMNPDYVVNRLYLDELMQEATRRLVALKARAVSLGLSVQTHIATGIPSEEVLSMARANDADLIVVGTRGKTGLEHVLLGSTAERIIRMAPCPVVTVPAERQRAVGNTNVEKTNVVNQMLVPVDFSDCSLDALEYGISVAQRSKASIQLLHVLEPVSYGLDFTLPHVATREQIRTELTGRLSNLVSALTSVGVPSNFTFSGGLPAESILNTAKSQSVDLIVMGTHGRRGLSRALFGSVAESILRKAPCPVLTVRSLKFQLGHRRVLSGQSILTNV